MASLSKWQIARVSRFCEKHESRGRWFYRRLLLKSNRQPWRTRNDLSNDRYRRYACEMRGWDKVRRKIPPSLCRHATKKRIMIMRLEMNTMPRDRDTQYSSHLEKFHSNAAGSVSSSIYRTLIYDSRAGEERSADSTIGACLFARFSNVFATIKWISGTVGWRYLNMIKFK